MASISSPGLGSGLDVNSIISQLMQVESQPLRALQKQEASFQAKLSAFGSLKGTLSAVQTAAKALATPTTFTGMSATVSNSTVLGASADSTAAAGSYAINVTQLAKYHAVRSTDPYTATTDTFTTGTLSIQVGSGTPVTVMNKRTEEAILADGKVSEVSDAQDVAGELEAASPAR